jgi:hypothetical protein
MRARGVACVIAAPRPVESTRRPWGERAALCPFPCEIVGGKGPRVGGRARGDCLLPSSCTVFRFTKILCSAVRVTVRRLGLRLLGRHVSTRRKCASTR